MNKLSLLVSAFLACGCGPITSGYFAGEPKPVEVVFKVDMLKSISTDVIDPSSEDSYQQKVYSISFSQRLLLQTFFSGIDQHIQNDKNTLRLRVEPVHAEQVSFAREVLKLCPVTRSWMAGATWKKANPLPKGGWTPGGEVAWAECIVASPITTPDIPEENAASNSLDTPKDVPSLCDQEQVLCFDVTNWYKLYVLESKTNFGWILVNESSVPISIFGDGMISKAPRLHSLQYK